MHLVDRPDRFEITWNPNGAIKRVTITDRFTGNTATGRDWRSWDAALQEALERASQWGDLIEDIEGFLESA